MQNELMIGSVGISVLLTILLRMIYGTFMIPKKAKPWIAVFIGIGLSLLVMMVGNIAFTAASIATYVVQGFMVGATAVGINEMIKKQDPG